MKTNVKVLLGLLVFILLLTPVAIGASNGWSGSETVAAIRQNLGEVKDRLASQNDKILDLETDYITRTEHEAIVKGLEDDLESARKSYANCTMSNSIIKQKLREDIEALEARVAELENELEQAYQDVEQINNEITSILEEDD